MNHSQIKKALKNKGLNFTLIGEALKPPVSGQAISKCAAGKLQSLRIAKAIAAALEKPLTEVFPTDESYRNGNTHLSTPQREKRKSELTVLFANIK